jgi:hypothetical protein
MLEGGLPPTEYRVWVGSERDLEGTLFNLFLTFTSIVETINKMALMEVKEKMAPEAWTRRTTPLPHQVHQSRSLGIDKTGNVKMRRIVWNL